MFGTVVDQPSHIPYSSRGEVQFADDVTTTYRCAHASFQDAELYILMRKCWMLISEKPLMQHEEYILRWAGSPSVIAVLTYQVVAEIARGV